MLKLEEYIYKRKKEDGINELDVDRYDRGMLLNGII